MIFLLFGFFQNQEAFFPIIEIVPIRPVASMAIAPCFFCLNVSNNRATNDKTI
jgi:hypothetical protein